MATHYCPRCRSPVSAKSSVCTHCGMALPPGGDYGEKLPPLHTIALESPRKLANGLSSANWFMAAVVLIVIAIVWWAFSGLQ